MTGIDVGTSHVKVVICSAKEKNEKGLPRILGTGLAETQGLRHGYVTNISSVTHSIKKAIAQAEEKSGLKIRRAFVGIGGIGLNSVTVVSSIMTTRADQEITELDIKNIQSQCEKDIPKTAIANRRIIYSIPLQYKIDNFPVLGRPEGMTGNKLELKTLFITCLEHHVNDLIQAVNDAHVEVEDIVASPIAASFVILNKNQKIAGCMLSNIGAETVSVATFENGLPTSLEVFPIGSTDITNDIALGLKVPLEEAEQIKIGAITGSSFPRKKLDEIISARMKDMFELMESHLKKIGRNGLLPAGIVISGGGSSLNLVDDMARVTLKLPSRIGTIGIESKTFKDSSWAVAYGLCLWGLHSEDDDMIDNSSRYIQELKKRVTKFFKQFIP
jgi:cell division protein FtsA